MTDWKPIETAPKDGTRMLLYLKEAHKHDPQRLTVGAVFGGSGSFYIRTSAITAHDSTWSMRHFTHWMPLPPPPETNDD